MSPKSSHIGVVHCYLRCFFPSWHTRWLLFSNFKPNINGLNWLSLMDTLRKTKKSCSNLLLFVPALVTISSLSYSPILQKYASVCFYELGWDYNLLNTFFTEFTFGIWTSVRVVKWKLIEMVENENNNTFYLICVMIKEVITLIFCCLYIHNSFPSPIKLMLPGSC